eukprot:CAMPEP_0113557238 /NCGR_PEP_ID=MMETSP0015_2-20120614/17681_1 /TAXON_ID=2838 /ORGANISM="Odontella" /LENGTH=91 /DNA_ID=CAMNT_0000458643 /DNA_START=136 /DNA_END=408 /DNA_ORIENTATION=+ /assembly_acc=CAM_ASM_000160
MTPHRRCLLRLELSRSAIAVRYLCRLAVHSHPAKTAVGVNPHPDMRHWPRAIHHSSHHSGPAPPAAEVHVFRVRTRPRPRNEGEPFHLSRI